MEAELHKQNPWWEGAFKPEGRIRQAYLDRIFSSMGSKEMIFLTGLRRTGKTTLMRQAIARLIAEGTDPRDILFLSLDAFNFLGSSIHDLVETYRGIHKKSVRDRSYLFLDEVASKEDFEMELKSFYDNENVKIICSSSIATLMRDKRAYLTGRTKTIEVMPLTFAEFLEFRDAKVSMADRAILDSQFRDYLRLGGIPYYVLTEDHEYLNELVQNIIYKDVIAYHNVANEKAVKELFVLLCERVGKRVSYHKLANVLGISVDSVKRYVDYFEKAYLFYTVDRHTKTLSERLTSPKKVYIGDVGIKNMVTGFRDLGSSYENLVFLKVKDKAPRYYYENGVELDFVTADGIIEAKYGRGLEGKQLKVFNSIKTGKKVASGAGFFMEG